MISNPALNPNVPPNDATRPASSPALLTISWLVVLLPLAWGVYNTVKTSTNLFVTSTPAHTAPQPGAAH